MIRPGCFIAHSTGARVEPNRAQERSMSPCTHRWRIDTPNGAKVVDARCVHCDARRTYPVANEDPTWIGQERGSTRVA